MKRFLVGWCWTFVAIIPMLFVAPHATMALLAALFANFVGYIERAVRNE